MRGGDKKGRDLRVWGVGIRRGKRASVICYVSDARTAKQSKQDDLNKCWTPETSGSSC